MLVSLIIFLSAPIIIFPPIVASEVTDKPVPELLLNVNVSAISAVLLASKAPPNVVIPVTPNVPPTVASVPIVKSPSPDTVPLIFKSSLIFKLDLTFKFWCIIVLPNTLRF